MKPLKKNMPVVLKSFTANSRMKRIARRKKLSPKQVLDRAIAMRKASNAQTLTRRIKKLLAEEAWLDQMLKTLKYEFEGTLEYNKMRQEREKSIIIRVNLINKLEAIRKEQAQRKSKK